MKAILLKSFGGPEQLYLGEQTDPSCGPQDLLVSVQATALNRADLLQRMGHYPPPPGASEILGLEMAGVVERIGSDVTGWAPGDRVCALLPGGGYAEKAVVRADMAMRIPENLSFEQAAAIPEAFLTAYLNLFWLGGFETGKRVLVHAGASGVGTAAIQLIREVGGVAYATAGTAEKLKVCSSLGTAAVWNYHDGSFLPWIREQTQGRGVDIILDFVGAPYFQDNVSALAMDGRLIIIGTMGGSEVPTVSLGTLLMRRLQVIGTALRSQSQATKAQLTQDFWNFAGDRFVDGRLVPILDHVYDWRDVAAAHTYMAENRNIGKIVMRVQ